jgi:glycosyltransferase involved in cell wall biosynthesis
VRILYICNEYPPEAHGGIGVFVQTLAERLAALGHATAVIGFSSFAAQPARSIEHGVEVLRLPLAGKPARPVLGGRMGQGAALLSARAMLSREARRLALAFQPDVTESHEWSGPLLTAPSRPLIVRLHGAASLLPARAGRRGRLVRFLEGRNLRLADAVVAVSDDIGKRTQEVFGIRCRSLATIHHGVDTDLFKPCGVPREPCEVLFVGTVKRQKGILDLFGAIPAIAERFPEARFTIAGRLPQPGADPCSPETLIGLLPPSVRPQVRFLGTVPREQLPFLYSRAAVAVFPSHAEAFGLSCAEAMACGAPVVMTTRGSGPELVEHDRCGLLADPENGPALAAAIVDLLGDEKRRERLSRNARSRVLERFSLANAVARNLAFYEQVVLRFHRRSVSYA